MMMTSALSTQKNVKLLREALKSYQDKGLDGFVIPKADPHQNEYIPPHFERLLWITGFTGSAGLTVILQDKAALFVDGRYTLQAHQEVDDSLFEIKGLNWLIIQEWIETHLPKGGRLGYDPWITFSASQETLKKACLKKAGELVPISENPLDGLWVDRPELVHQPVLSHPLKYAGQSASDKLDALFKSISSEGVDSLLLTKLDTVAWLLNIRGRDIPYNPLSLAYVRLEASGGVHLYVGTDASYQEIAKSLEIDRRVKFHPYDQFQKDLRTIKGQTVWVDPKSTSVGILHMLKNQECQLYKASNPCELPKAIKNPVEIIGARAAHSRDGAALVQFLSWLDQEIHQGRVTERSAAEYLLHCRHRQALFQQPSFETISAFEGHGAIVHYRVTEESDQPLRLGGMYLVDSGGQYLDGTTDVTRTLSLGGTPTLEQKDRFTRVLKGHIALARAHFPKGTTGHQLDALARQYLWEIGLDYAHGTGHGVGSYLNVHEGPQSISNYPTQAPLEAGMILSNEPGYYKEGAYGIRIESLILVIESERTGFLSFETLTLVPLDLSLVDINLLTPGEKKWLEGYHRQVLTLLSPHLDTFSKRWLEKHV